MHIQCEPTEQNAIQSYDETTVIIANQPYSKSIFINKNDIIVLPYVNSLQDINYLWLLDLVPNIKKHLSILLIGQNKLNQFLNPEQYISFTTNNIGVEYMQFGSACRTFNLLLNEERKVGMILLFDEVYTQVTWI